MWYFANNNTRHFRLNAEERFLSIYQHAVPLSPGIVGWLMSYGDYSLYQLREMMPENKRHFGRALRQFISEQPFSSTLFSGEAK